MAQGKRVAIYARYSSDKQSDASIDDQVHRCREHLSQQGLDDSGVEVFSDYAMSGASLQRPRFEAMMRAVESGSVTQIVTEDISRISRDFADSAAIFKQLQFAQVALIGIADGVDTSQQNALLSYGVKSLLNNIYLSDLADKTRRGLEGRFRKELATGAVAYGYRTKKRIPEGTGSDIIIESDEAERVRRIFRLYLDGVSYAGIAKELNAEGIPTPRARTKHDAKHKPRGWVPTTIRAMLKNESYVGRWRYKSKQWVKRPGTNKRVSRSRPESEVLTHDLPHLAIVPRELWDGVNAILAHNAKTRSQKPGAPRATYLLSGLLRCGVCGESMVVYGGSASSRRYRCVDNAKRGTCVNRQSLREDTARAAVLGELRHQLMRPAGVTYIRREVARRLGESFRGIGAELTKAQQTIGKLDTQIGNLVGFIASGNASDAVALNLNALEAKRLAEQQRIGQLKQSADAPIPLPDVQTITTAVTELNALLTKNPKVGRAALHRLFKGSLLRCEPGETGYRLQGDLMPLMVVAENATADPEQLGSAIYASGSGD